MCTIHTKYFNLIMQQQINQEATNPTRTSYKKVHKTHPVWLSKYQPACLQTVITMFTIWSESADELIKDHWSKTQHGAEFWQFVQIMRNNVTTWMLLSASVQFNAFNVRLELTATGRSYNKKDNNIHVESAKEWTCGTDLLCNRGPIFEKS